MQTNQAANNRRIKTTLSVWDTESHLVTMQRLSDTISLVAQSNMPCVIAYLSVRSRADCQGGGRGKHVPSILIDHLIALPSWGSLRQKSVHDPLPKRHLHNLCNRAGDFTQQTLSLEQLVETLEMTTQGRT